MVQVVGRVWIWLWASDLENQGIESKSQPASFSLLWLSPQTINGSCFLKASPDFLKTCSSLLKFTKGMFQMKALLFFPVPSFFGASSLQAIQFPCMGSCHSCWVHVMPIITHFNQTPQMNCSLTCHWPYVKSKLFRVNSLKRSANWSTGLLNTSRITGIKS